MGWKMRQIEFATTCSVRVSRHEDTTEGPMTIKIQCTSSDVTTQSRPHSNVTKAIDMIEESIVKFLPDRDAEWKMLYELAAKAAGSYKLPRDHEFVQRKYGGVKRWCTIFDLPMQGGPLQEPGWSTLHRKCIFLKDLKALERNDCLIKVLDDIAGTAPYMLIYAAKKKEVEEIALEIVNAVKRHQRNCKCGPKW